MNLLELKDLKENTYYYCPLLKNNVLCISVLNQSNLILGKTYEWIEAKCIFWNNVTGRYDELKAYDFQLMPTTIKHDEQ